MNYPNELYRGTPNFIPSFYSDDLADWTPGNNPAFAYCEAKAFLAYRDGEIVGRIGAILSHKANEKFGTHRMRFSQVDFIDDADVSAALFAAVESWAREKGCTEVHGPLGFTDLDREGMLVEGFDRRSLFITNYNHPYYPEHLERLGYHKDVDWIERLITVPTDEATIKRYYDQQDANNENKRICQDSSEEEKPIDYGLRLLSDINTKKPPLSPLQIAINNLQVCLWTT